MPGHVWEIKFQKSLTGIKCIQKNIGIEPLQCLLRWEYELARACCRIIDSHSSRTISSSSFRSAISLANVESALFSSEPVSDDSLDRYELLKAYADVFKASTNKNGIVHLILERA